MYDPTVGRWLSEDPIGFESGDANLHRYVRNAPLNLIDPTGLFEFKYVGSKGVDIRQSDEGIRCIWYGVFVHPANKEVEQIENAGGAHLVSRRKVSVSLTECVSGASHSFNQDAYFLDPIPVEHGSINYSGTGTSPGPVTAVGPPVADTPDAYKHLAYFPVIHFTTVDFAGKAPERERGEERKDYDQRKREWKESWKRFECSRGYVETQLEIRLFLGKASPEGFLHLPADKEKWPASLQGIGGVTMPSLYPQVMHHAAGYVATEAPPIWSQAPSSQGSLNVRVDWDCCSGKCITKITPPQPYKPGGQRRGRG